MRDATSFLMGWTHNQNDLWEPREGNFENSIIWTSHYETLPVTQNVKHIKIAIRASHGCVLWQLLEINYEDSGIVILIKFLVHSIYPMKTSLTFPWLISRFNFSLTYTNDSLIFSDSCLLWNFPDFSPDWWTLLFCLMATFDIDVEKIPKHFIITSVCVPFKRD